MVLSLLITVLISCLTRGRPFKLIGWRSVFAAGVMFTVDQASRCMFCSPGAVYVLVFLKFTIILVKLLLRI